MSNEHLKHESLYRGADKVANRAKKRLTFCGVGAVGSWTTELMVRQGYHSVCIIDCKKVDHAKYGTQNYGQKDAGRLKVAQMATNVALRLGVQLSKVDKKLTEANAKTLLKDSDLVICSFDNYQSRKIVRDTCKALNIPLIQSGMGTKGSFVVMWNQGFPIPDNPTEDDPDAPCEYALAANQVQLCVGVTAEVINRFIDNGEMFDAEFWLGSMKMDWVKHTWLNASRSGK